VAFSDAELAEIYVEAEERFRILRPPGFSDAKNKGVPEKYADVVIWFELIEHAKTEKKPLIFVTDDRKEDWWVKKNGKTISPRPELLEEFQKKTNSSMYMYQTEQFIEYALSFSMSKTHRQRSKRFRRSEDKTRHKRLNKTPRLKELIHRKPFTEPSRRVT
jgi:PIN like domain